MSRLQGRIDRLEQREGTLMRVPQHTDGPTLEGYFNALMTREEREAYISLVQAVHAVQEREHDTEQVERSAPPRTPDEQARMDELITLLAAERDQ